jgi:hypothetical protein
MTEYAWERAKEEEDLLGRSSFLDLQSAGKMYLNGVEAGTVKTNDDDDYMPGWENELAKWNARWQGKFKTAYGRRLLQSMQEANLAMMGPQLLDAKNRKQAAYQNGLREHVIEQEKASGAPARDIIENTLLERNTAFETGGINSVAGYLNALKSDFTSIGANDLVQFIDTNFDGWFARGDSFEQILGHIKGRLAELPDRLTIKDPDGGGPEGESGRPQEPTEPAPVDLERYIGQRRETDEDIREWEKSRENKIQALTNEIKEIERMLANPGSDRESRREELRAENANEENPPDVEYDWILDKEEAERTKQNKERLAKLRRDLNAAEGEKFDDREKLRQWKREAKKEDEWRRSLHETNLAEYHQQLNTWMNDRPRPTEGFTDKFLDTRAWKQGLLDAAAEDLERRWNRAADEGRRTSGRTSEKLPISEVVRSIVSLRNSLLKGAVAHVYNGEEITAAKAFDIFDAGVNAILVGSGYELGDRDLLFSKEIGIHEFFTDLGKTLKEMDPNFTETSFIPLEKALAALAKKKGLSPEMTETIRRQVTGALFNVIWDTGLYSRSTEEWLDFGKDLAQKMTAGEIDILQLTEDGESQLKNLTGSASDEDRVALYEQLHDNLDAVSETGGRVNYAGNLKTYQNLQGWAAKDIVRNLGLPSDIVDTGKVRADWDRETGKGDIAPIPTVIITGTDKDGTYKYDLKKARDLYGQEKNALALYRMDASGSWKEVKEGTAEKNTEAALQENRNARLDEVDAETVEENITKLSNFIKDGSFYQGRNNREIQGALLNFADQNHVPLKSLLLRLVEHGANPFGGGAEDDIGERIRGTYPDLFTDSEIADIEARLRGTR